MEDSQQIDTGDSLSRLDALILKHFGDRVILKPLTRWNEAYKEFPRYVLEYLCARYIDPNDPLPGQRKIDKILQEHYVESGAKELIKHRIAERREYSLLGPLTLSYDQRRLHYWADVPALGDPNVRVSERVIKEFGDTLLTSGAWGTMKIEFDPEYKIGNRAYPFRVVDFTPFQVTRLSLDDFIEKRRCFSTQDWIDLLIQTLGFNPFRLSERVKHLILVRLVAFVELNYNLIELGPRQTGKTYMYKNTSQRAFVVSSGKASAATLFHHGTTRKIGLVGVKDVVIFDEIAVERDNVRKLDPASIDTLKNYMAQGSYSKDGIEFTSTCSIVLGGNIDTDLKEQSPIGNYRHLFQPLPEELREDTAFLDRIHSYLPGWEMPVIKPSNYSTGYGFISDYIAEIFRLLRRRNYQTHIVAGARFPAGMSQRAHDAIQKTAAGLLKLIYPHRTPDDLEPSELRFCLNLAVEMRNRVVDQLKIIAPKEFKDVSLEYELKLV
jgi:ATP-dependent Lon protease